METGKPIPLHGLYLAHADFFLLRLAAADDEESIEEKSDGNNSDDDNGNDKGEAEDAEKEAMMSTYTGRRSRRYLAPILEPGNRRSLAELPQQFSVSQKLRDFIS